MLIIVEISMAGSMDPTENETSAATVFDGLPIVIVIWDFHRGKEL